MRSRKESRPARSGIQTRIGLRSGVCKSTRATTAIPKDEDIKSVSKECSIIARSPSEDVRKISPDVRRITCFPPSNALPTSTTVRPNGSSVLDASTNVNQSSGLLPVCSTKSFCHLDQSKSRTRPQRFQIRLPRREEGPWRTVVAHQSRAWRTGSGLAFRLAFKLYTLPRLVRITRPARSSTLTCFETPASERSRDAARSVTRVCP